MRDITKNKKGYVNNIYIAIIAVAAILVFSIFLYTTYSGLKEKMELQSCKDSIEAHKIVATGTARELFTDIKCPTNEITIKDLKTANELIAEDMHRCWYIWDQGKGQFFEGDGSFCHICSIYQFGDKGKRVDGLTQYLGTTNIKVKYAGDVAGVTYQDYFQGYATPNSAEKIKNNKIQSLSDSDFLNTSQKYATIFVYASGKENIDKMLEGGGRTTLGAVGLGSIMLGTAGGVYGVSALGAAVGASISAAAGTAATVAAVNIWNPIGWVVGGALLIGAGVYAVYTATHPGDPEWVSFIVFRPYTEDSLKEIGCEKFAVNQMSGTSG